MDDIYRFEKTNVKNFLNSDPDHTNFGIFGSIVKGLKNQINAKFWKKLGYATGLSYFSVDIYPSFGPKIAVIKPDHIEIFDHDDLHFSKKVYVGSIDDQLKVCFSDDYNFACIYNRFKLNFCDLNGDENKIIEVSLNRDDFSIKCIDNVLLFHTSSIGLYDVICFNKNGDIISISFDTNTKLLRINKWSNEIHIPENYLHFEQVSNSCFIFRIPAPLEKNCLFHKLGIVFYEYNFNTRVFEQIRKCICSLESGLQHFDPKLSNIHVSDSYLTLWSDQKVVRFLCTDCSNFHEFSLENISTVKKIEWIDDYSALILSDDVVFIVDFLLNSVPIKLYNATTMSSLYNNGAFLLFPSNDIISLVYLRCRTQEEICGKILEVNGFESALAYAKTHKVNPEFIYKLEWENSSKSATDLIYFEGITDREYLFKCLIDRDVSIDVFEKIISKYEGLEDNDQDFRKLLAQFKRRLKIFKDLTRTDVFCQSDYRHFMTSSMFILVTGLLARSHLNPALLIIKNSYKLFRNHYFAILCLIPEVIPISEMSKLLPIFIDEQLFLNSECVSTKMSYESIFDQVIEDEFINNFYKQNPDLLIFKNRFDPESAIEWYIYRSDKIFENSKMVKNSLDLQLFAIEHGVSISQSVVYDTEFLLTHYKYVEKLSLAKFIKFSTPEKFIYLLNVYKYDQDFIDSFLVFYNLTACLTQIIVEIPFNIIRLIIKKYKKFKIDQNAVVDGLYLYFQRSEDLETLKIFNQCITKTSLEPAQQLLYSKFYVYFRIQSILQKLGINLTELNFNDIFIPDKNFDIFNKIFLSIKFEHFHSEFVILELISCIHQINSESSILNLKHFFSISLYQSETHEDIAIVYDLFRRGFEIHQLPLKDIYETLLECTTGYLELIKEYNDKHYMIAKKCAEISKNSKILNMFDACEKVYNIIPKYDLKKIFEFDGEEFLSACIKRGDLSRNLDKIIEAYCILSETTSIESEGVVYQKILDYYFENKKFDFCQKYCDLMLKIGHERSWYYCHKLAIYQDQLRKSQRLNYCYVALKSCPVEEISRVVSTIKKCKEKDENLAQKMSESNPFLMDYLSINSVYHIAEETLINLCKNFAKNLPIIDKLIYCNILRYLYDSKILTDIETLQNVLSADPNILICIFEQYLPSVDRFQTFFECKKRIQMYNFTTKLSQNVVESSIINNEGEESNRDAHFAVLSHLKAISAKEHNCKRLHEILLSDSFISDLKLLNIKTEELQENLTAILARFGRNQIDIMQEWFMFSEKLVGNNIFYKNLTMSQHIECVEKLKNCCPELDYNSLLAGNVSNLGLSLNQSNLLLVSEILDSIPDLPIKSRDLYILYIDKTLTGFDERVGFIEPNQLEFINSLWKALSSKDIRHIIDKSLFQSNYSYKKLFTIVDYFVNDLLQIIPQFESELKLLNQVHTFYESCFRFEEKLKDLPILKYPKSIGVDEMYNILQVSEHDHELIDFLASLYGPFMDEAFSDPYIERFVSDFHNIHLENNGSKKICFILKNLALLQSQNIFKRILSEIGEFLYQFYLKEEITEISFDGLKIINCLKSIKPSSKMDSLEEFYEIQMCLSSFLGKEFPINIDLNNIQNREFKIDLLQFLLHECKLPSHLVAISDLIKIFVSKKHDQSLHQVIKDFLILCVGKFKNSSIVSELFISMKYKEILDQYSCTEVYSLMWENSCYLDAVRFSLATKFQSLISLALFDMSTLDINQVQPMLNDSFINESYIILNLIHMVRNQESYVYDSLVEYCLNFEEFQYYDKDTTGGLFPLLLLFEKLEEAGLKSEVMRIKNMNTGRNTGLMSSIIGNITKISFFDQRPLPCNQGCSAEKEVVNAVPFPIRHNTHLPVTNGYSTNLSEKSPPRLVQTVYRFTQRSTVKKVRKKPTSKRNFALLPRRHSLLRNHE